VTGGSLSYQLRQVVFDGERVSGQAAFGFTVPVRTVNKNNVEEHWAVRRRRVLRERNAVVLSWPRLAVQVPCEVNLVRIAPARNHLDSDGATAAVKTVRDEVARLIGVDDGDQRVTWTTGPQEVGAWGVRVEIRYQLGGQVLPPRPRPKGTPRPRKTTAPRLLPRAQAQAGFQATPNFIPARKP
jgi:hypothetical protein